MGTTIYHQSTAGSVLHIGVGVNKISTLLDGRVQVFSRMVVPVGSPHTGSRLPEGGARFFVYDCPENTVAESHAARTVHQAFVGIIDRLHHVIVDHVDADVDINIRPNFPDNDKVGIANGTFTGSFHGGVIGVKRQIRVQIRHDNVLL